MINWFKKLFSKPRVADQPKATGVLRKVFNLLTQQTLTSELAEKIETLLLEADVGTVVTEEILQQLTLFYKNHSTPTPQQIEAELKKIIITKLEFVQKPFQLEVGATNVIVVVGVNGVGKTTTIGKLSYYFSQKKLQVILAAGDTFRAAATNQLQQWGDFNNVEVISRGEGVDGASVIYDAICTAVANKKDVVLADTSGRMGNKKNLMLELEKVTRVAQKALGKKVQHCLLVLDVSTGQNSIEQVKQFSNIIPISGLVLTKFDGSAKGGILLALAGQFSLPVYFLGIGEGREQLICFDPEYVYQSIVQ